jgi:hypothetical protein
VPSSYLFELKLFISIKGSHERISMEFRVWLFNLSAKQYFLDRRKQLTVFGKKKETSLRLSSSCLEVFFFLFFLFFFFFFLFFLKKNQCYCLAIFYLQSFVVKLFRLDENSYFYYLFLFF